MVVILLSALLACAPAAPEQPEDLYGIWSSRDGADWRVDKETGESRDYDFTDALP